jgi:hypothetical protein
MRKLYRIYEFFFKRWKEEIIERGSETWSKTQYGINLPYSEYKRNYVLYKLTNKFDSSEKIKKQYLN